MNVSQLDTPIGPMLAIADDERLYLLDSVERTTKRLEKRTRSKITPGRTPAIESIERELDSYFSGRLREFTTPLALLGTPFQQQVWKALQQIPLGETRSYAGVAVAIGRPTALRAVARANSSNCLAIIVPCHRVINSNGTLGGYGGGISGKEWLLAHEA